MGIIVDLLSTLLLILYSLLGQNVVLAIVAFTVIVRLSLLPLTIKQQRSMKRMQELSPKLKQLQTKYKDDRETLVQEQMKLYKEHGVNPFAGCLPLLIQLPIFFGLWRAIIATLASSPGQLLELQNHIMLPGLDHLIPLHNTFLWLNLALPDPYFVLPVIVVVTTYLQQRLIMPVRPKTNTPTQPRKPGQRPDASEQAEQMTRQMTTIMPFFLGFLSLSYSSGLSIYFIVSNLIGIMQYAMMGKADFRRLIGKESPKAAAEAAARRSEAEAEDGMPLEAATATATPSASTGRSERQLKPGMVMTTLKNAPPSSTASGNTSSKRSGSTSRSSAAARRSATATRTRSSTKTKRR
ncbi:MAG: membrane protein insertase YidC [Anaerolineales bacterium]|nr:membrane protein insertase YidC [Anaerolineales bacterium]